MASIQEKLQRFTLGESLKDEFVSICLVRDIHNSEELLKILTRRNHPKLLELTQDQSRQFVILMNARMIYNLEHILISLSICLLRKKFRTKTKTKAFETEVIYNMSPSTNISATLKTFGITDTTKDVACLFVNIDNSDLIEDFLGLIQGQVDFIDNLSKVHEISEIAKVSIKNDFKLLFNSK
ncbi:Kinase binding protein CGI-121 family protein [Cryptosporidium meleagridis]|uniref:Kinase binding protein CGI-121 family protein n=1 Tax=Cryptosporidium meleagridis TaxID=93969 RepID=A0A2P4YWY0_9CRYT|nr:Kinase binding protein CGI-121 family protein [Cryptosporidium meleagridis]